MEAARRYVKRKDRALVFKAIGALLLVVGVAAALLGPAEMYCFYLFSEGGRFHYEGFGFGSFMFGNIACQIIGYYLLAILFVALGYGHIRVRRWARTLVLTLLWSWLVVGVPLTIVFLFILFSTKDLSPVVALIAVISLGLSYPAAPGLLIWLYRSQSVRTIFERSQPSWLDRLPMPILVLGLLFVFYAVVLHVPIFFRGLFPLFGVWLSGLQGILALDVSIACLACLAWGVLRQRTWAWWGSLAYFSLLTSSLVLTLLRSSYAAILSRVDFPPTEMEALQGLPIQGVHLAVFIGVPLIITLGVIVLSKRHFEARPPGTHDADDHP
jgi:hypothetical protein